MTTQTRTLGRIVAIAELTPEEIAEVNGGEFYMDPTFNASPDSISQGKPDDCTADG